MLWTLETHTRKVGAEGSTKNLQLPSYQTNNLNGASQVLASTEIHLHGEKLEFSLTAKIAPSNRMLTKQGGMATRIRIGN